MQDANPARGPIDVRPATTLLREILDLTERFESYLGSELAVNATDLDAMQHLIKDGPLSPTDLAGRLGVSTAAATTVVDRLAAVGHASRMPNPEDRRGVLVVPAPRSVEKAMATLLPMILGIDGVLDEFSDQERRAITAYLGRVVEVYRAQLPEVDPG